MSPLRERMIEDITLPLSCSPIDTVMRRSTSACCRIPSPPPLPRPASSAGNPALPVAADYLSAHGASMLPSHRRAIEDILDYRTAALGGQVWRCDACGIEVFSFHSCGNRSCPKCHTGQTQEWLEHRQAEMLPVPYFHITVTVPTELREVLRANQRDGYPALMQADRPAGGTFS